MLLSKVSRTALALWNALEGPQAKGGLPHNVDIISQCISALCYVCIIVHSIDGALTFIHVCVDGSRTVLEHHSSSRCALGWIHHAL